MLASLYASASDMDGNVNRISKLRVVLDSNFELGT